MGGKTQHDVIEDELDPAQPLCKLEVGEDELILPIPNVVTEGESIRLKLKLVL